MKISCHSCAKILEFDDNAFVGRADECHSCHADIHVCLMCKFYSLFAYNECVEPVAERIVEKDKANFCEYFKLGESANKLKNNAADAKKAAEALFMKKR